jgi:hypothetical protein
LALEAAHAPPEELATLQAALKSWREEGPAANVVFPTVHATLTIQVGPQPLRVAWKQSRAYTAAAGENGFYFDPPRLRNAVASPSGSILLVELYGSEGSEFVRLTISPALPRLR